MNASSCTAPGEYDVNVPPNQSISFTDPEYSFLIFIYCFSVAWMSLNLFFFLRHKHRFTRTRLRISYFVALFGIGILLFSSGFVLPLLVGIENFPCWVSFGLTCLSLGFFQATSFSRNTAFMLMSKLSFATYKFGRIPVEETSKAEEVIRNLGFFARIAKDIELITYGFRFVFSTNNKAIINAAKDHEDHLMTLMSLRFLTSIRGSALFVFVIIFFYLVLVCIICLADPTFLNGCTGCLPDNTATVATFMGLGFFIVLNSVFFAVKCRGLPDAWGTFAETRGTAVGVVIGALGFTLVSFLPIGPSKYLVNFVAVFGFNSAFFVASALQLILGAREEPAQLQRMITKMPTMHQFKVKSTTDSYGSTVHQQPAFLVSDLGTRYDMLARVLENPKLSRLFAFSCAKEFCMENLSFLEDVLAWKQAFADTPSSANVARAKKIIGTYVLSDGLNQVNLPSELNEKMKRFHAQATGDTVPDIKMFDECRAEIAMLLQTGPLRRFLVSEEFKSNAQMAEITSALDIRAPEF